MAVEEVVKQIFQEVLDVSPEEIKPNDPLEKGLGVDSTEMVEISVGLKKRLKVSIGDNELKKSHSFNDIVGILRTKGLN
jgi:acyl carrier protein